MHCTVNPVCWKGNVQRDWKTRTRLEVSKKILIIGAGPAGLEAARIASERGHKVTIYEKSGEIGGQANWAKMLPGRADIGSIVTWYSTQLQNNEVRIEFHKEVPVDPYTWSSL